MAGDEKRKLSGKELAEPLLLRWSKHLPASDVQDPLGLSLRGSARLGSSLLYCITSITPRARYFAFVPWCIFEFQKNEKGKAFATGLDEALVLREHALTLGCVAHHGGKPCAGGNLVGSDKAIVWFAKQSSGEADFKRLRFVKIPAYRAYRSPLVNLGVFVTDDELPADEDGEEQQRTFEDIELSPLGRELAEGYGAAVDDLQVVRQIGSPTRKCSIPALKQLGKHGGLCEITGPTARDRTLLRDIFFCRKGLSDGSHSFRRRSLLLMLELCRQLSVKGHPFDQVAFADAVYFGEVQLERGRLKVELPPSLNDIAIRWRMFYFHYYCGIALEAMFSWLVTDLGGAGVAGRSMDELVKPLKQKTVRSDFKKLLGFDVSDSVLEMSPARILSFIGITQALLTDKTSKAIDDAVPLGSSAAEPVLEKPLWDGDYQEAPTGLALPMLLLVVTLGRYKQWESTKYGDWLAGFVKDPYLDLLPPVLLTGLTRHFGDWWNGPMEDLIRFVLFRYVIKQHEAMSYEKTFAGDRCLLHVDGMRIASSGRFDKIGIGNARFRSAQQILMDLGLLIRGESEDILRLTSEGKQFLKEELAIEEAK